MRYNATGVLRVERVYTARLIASAVISISYGKSATQLTAAGRSGVGPFDRTPTGSSNRGCQPTGE